MATNELLHTILRNLNERSTHGTSTLSYIYIEKTIYAASNIIQKHTSIIQQFFYYFTVVCTRFTECDNLSQKCIIRANDAKLKVLKMLIFKRIYTLYSLYS